MYAPRTLSLANLQDWVPRLAAMTAAERSKLPGVSEGRSEQLVAGALVAEAAMDLLDIRELVICPWALREGVILHRMDTLPT
jgi:exopolyphosphatase/guanosine-5'-triphosphate,3'-diphosphate pyrophosphatase